jgi:DNA processing protein
MRMEEATPAKLLGPLNDVERKNAPELLYLAGNAELLRTGRRVSVVGSRRVSPEGARRAAALVRTLVEQGITVVSGLAEGVDTVAHETSLELDGHTVAVLGNPLDRFYPAKNRPLQERMMRKELVVSQFPLGYPAQKKNFPMRNRTMALLSDATIIVEAGEKSGTVHQGWEALRLGRPLFLMSNIVENAALSWPGEMMKYGAQPLTRDNLLDASAETPALTHVTAIAF